MSQELELGNVLLLYGYMISCSLLQLAQTGKPLEAVSPPVSPYLKKTKKTETSFSFAFLLSEIKEGECLAFNLTSMVSTVL